MLTPDEKRLRANAYSKAWRAANPEKTKQVKARCYANNPNYKLANKKWQDSNKEWHTVYMANRRQAEPLFKLLSNLRCLIGSSFRYGGWSKTTKTQALLGCTFEEFVTHLQSKFKTGMTLENHGDWHIDHIKPCATATTPDELAVLFHFTNLQPLWASENLSKGSMYDV